MSTYLTQPRTFKPYTPEVDADLYGRVLQQKEQKYQQGIQNIQSNFQSIASLPIANLADRQYTQEKLNNITSQLNQGTGVDWSDRSVQKMTSQHINAIANDPIIENAVTNSIALKRDYNIAKDSHDATDGADVANQWHFNNRMAEYVNNPSPNTKYKPGFINYTDINKGAEDYLSKIKPDLLQLVKTAANEKGVDTMQGWELATRKYEGIDRQKLQTALDEYINTTPGVRDQMGVNAAYTYKDYQPEHYLQRVQAVNLQQAAYYSKNLVDLDRQKLMETDPAKLSQIEQDIKSTQKGLVDLANHDYESDYNHFVENRDSAISNIYERNWKLGVLTRFSGGNKYEENYSGMSPRDTYFQQKTKDLAERKFQYDMQKDIVDNKFKQSDYDLKVKEYQAKYNPAPVTTISSPLVGGSVDYAIAIHQKSESLRQNVKQSTIDLLAGLYSSKGIGTDDIGTSDYFDTKDDGQVVIKNGYIPLTDNASTALLHPTLAVVSGLEYGKDYVSYEDNLLGYTDNKGQKHIGEVDRLLNDYNKPTNKLSFPQKQQLSTIRAQRDEADAYSALEVTINKKVEQRLANDPIGVQLGQQLDQYTRPFSVERKGDVLNFSKPELEGFLKKYIEVNKEADNDFQPELGINKEDYLINKLGKYYNYDNNKMSILVQHFKGVDKKQAGYLEKKGEIAKQVAKQFGASPITNAIVMTDGKEETLKRSASEVQRAVNYLDPNAKSYDDVRKFLAKGDKGDISVSISQGYDEYNPTQPYFYELSTGKGKPERVYLNDREARSVGFPVDKVTPIESKVSKLLRINGVAYGNGFQSTVPVGKSNAWENARDLVVTPKDHVRFIVEHPKNGSYVLYKYWAHDGKVEREDESFSTMEGVDNRLQQLQQLR